MNETLHSTITMLAAIMAHAQLKASRHFLDLFADRIRQAASESSLLGFWERLASLVDA